MDKKRKDFLKLKIKELLDTESGSYLVEYLKEEVGFDKTLLSYATKEGSMMSDSLVVRVALRDFVLNLINLKDLKDKE